MRIIRILIILLFFSNQAFALEQGVNSPTQNSGNWSNGRNAYTSNDGRATVEDIATRTHDYWGYGFTLPSYATVLGVEVICEARREPGCGSWGSISIKVSEDGGSAWSAAETSVAIANTDTDYTFGSSSNLWGLSLVPSEVNSDNFRTQINGVQCVVEGSLITVPGGSVLIEDLKAGQEVLSFNGDFYEIDSVIDITESTTDKIYVINGELNVTGEHPVFCAEKNDYVLAKELRIGDTLKYIKPVSDNECDVIDKKIFDISIIDKKVKVFDIAVKKNNNFWASGYLLHNKGDISCDFGFTWTWQLDWMRVRVYYSIPWISKKIFYQERTPAYKS
jgi:hypothetical protein